MSAPPDADLELLRRVEAMPQAQMRDNALLSEDFSDEGDTRHKKSLNRREERDSYELGAALKAGTRRMITAIAFGATLCVLAFFIALLYLGANYTFDVASDPTRTQAVLYKLIEWAVVVCTGLFIQGAFAKAGNNR